MNKIYTLIVTLMLCLAFASCNNEDDEQHEQHAKSSAFTLSDTVLHLQVGDTVILKAPTSYGNQNFLDFFWYSDDKSVVDCKEYSYVCDSCAVFAVGGGETAIIFEGILGYDEYSVDAVSTKCRVIVDPKFCTVSFDLKGGTGDFPTQSVELGHTAVEPKTVPTKDGYTFLGWDFEGNEYWNVDFSRPIKDDITFFARWKENVKIDYVDLGVVVNGEKILWANVNTYGYCEKLLTDLNKEELNSLPTQEEWDALTEQCYCVWNEEPQGVYIFKAHNGHTSQNHSCASSFGEYNIEKDPYIFLPSDGYHRCYYWTGTPVGDGKNQYQFLSTTSSIGCFGGYNSIGKPWCIRFVKRSK